MLRLFYDRFLLAYPKTALLVILLGVAVLRSEEHTSELQSR